MRLESKGKISQPTQGNGGVKLSSFQELAKTGYTHHGVSCAVLPSLLIKYRMSLSQRKGGEKPQGSQCDGIELVVGYVENPLSSTAPAAQP